MVDAGELEDHANRKELLDRIASDITDVLDDKERKERTSIRMGRVLFGGIVSYDDTPEPQEILSPEEQARYRLIEPYLALAQMPSVVRQCEFYFRRYPFAGLPVSRSDHLRNVCEMYFDRVIQFRDRLKRMLTICRDDQLIGTADVGRWLKAFDRAFSFEHRSRNCTHHAARFDYTGLSRLGLAELLGGSLPEEVNRLLSPATLYRKEAKGWIQRVQNRGDVLESFVERVAGLLLTSPTIPPRTKGAATSVASAQ